MALARPMVVAALDWRVDDGHYVSYQEATKLAAMLQTELAQTAGYQWVERVALEEAARELALSRVSDPAVWLRVGAWVNADMLITGRVESVRDGWRLRGQVIDVERADVLASWDTTIRSEGGGPLNLSGMDIDQWIKDARNALVGSLDVYEKSRQQVAVAALFFENQTDVGRRIDHLEFRLDDVLETAFASNDRVRLLRFPGAQIAAHEFELALSGLAQGSENASRRLADVYVWGTYREVDWQGVPFREVPIEFTLKAWTGKGKPVETVYRGAAGEMDTLINEIASGIVTWAADQEQAEDLHIDSAAAQRISKTLWDRATRLQVINRRGNYDISPAFLHRWRRTVRQLETAFFFDPDNAKLHREVIAERWRDDLTSNGRAQYAEPWRRAARDTEIQWHIDRFGYGTSWPTSYPAPGRGWTGDNRFPTGGRMSVSSLYSLRDLTQIDQGLRETPDEVLQQDQKKYRAMALRRAREIMKLWPDSETLFAALSIKFRDRPNYAIEMIELAWPGLDKTVTPTEHKHLTWMVTRAFEKAGNPQRATELLDQLKVDRSEDDKAGRRDPDALPDDMGPFDDYLENVPNLKLLSFPPQGLPEKLDVKAQFIKLPNYKYNKIYQVWRLGDSLWVNLNLYNRRYGNRERNTWRYTIDDGKWHNPQGWIRVNRQVMQAISMPDCDPEAAWVATDGHSVGRITADGQSRVLGPVSGLTSTRFRAATATKDRLIFAGGESSERAQLNMYLPKADDWIALAVPVREDKAIPAIKDLAANDQHVLMAGDYSGILPMLLCYNLQMEQWIPLRDAWMTHLATAPNSQPLRPRGKPDRFNPDVLISDPDGGAFWIGSQAGLTRYQPEDGSFHTWFAKPPHHPDDPHTDDNTIRHFGAITAMAALPDGRHLVVATESRRSQRGLLQFKREGENDIGTYLFLFDRIQGEWKGYIDFGEYALVPQLLVDGSRLWMIKQGGKPGIAYIFINELLSEGRD